MPRRMALILVLVFAAGLLLAGCGVQPASAPAAAMAPAAPAASALPARAAPKAEPIAVSALPEEVQAAPARVRAAYQFAVANPDALKNVPCYCGCGEMGHTSNLSCYVKDRQADGTIVYDEHALGCSLCVDIAQDVMRMTGESKAPDQIHSAIVEAYSKFGPPNQ